MGGFLSILSEFSCLASVLCTCFSCTFYVHIYIHVGVDATYSCVLIGAHMHI